MADLSDAEIDQLLGTSGGATTLSDSDIDKLLAESPQHESAFKALTHQALKGATMGFSNYALSPETEAANKRYEKEHPYLSTAAQAAGFVAPMMTPAGWLARGGAALRYVPGASKAFEYLLPYGHFSRSVAPNASARTVLHQSGMGS